MKVVLVCVVFSSGFLANKVTASNDDSDLHSNLLRAEQTLLQAKLAQQECRLRKLDDLMEQGHASWLEMRQQRLAVDVLSAASQLLSEYLLMVDQQDIQFDLMLPTIPGWSLNGLSVDELSERLGQAKKEKHRLDQNLAELAKSLPDNQRIEQVCRLRFEIVAAQVAVLQLRLDVLTRDSANNSENQNTEFCQEHADRAVFARGNSDRHAIDLALIEQAEIGVQINRHRLAEQRDRAAVISKLFQAGVMSESMVNRATVKVNELKQSLDRQLENLKKLKQSEHVRTQVTTVANVQITTDRERERSTETSSWGYVQMVAICQAEYLRRIATIEREYLQQVLQRLRSAEKTQNVTAPKPRTSQLAEALARGQQREIARNQGRIELCSLRENLLTSQIDFLNFDASGSRDFEQLTALNDLHHSTGCFPIAYFDADFDAKLPDLAIFRGVERVASFSSDRFKPNNARTLALDRPGHSRPIGAAQSQGLYLTNNESPRHSIRSGRLIDRAYPFGILRSDLRSFATPGQSPWYLPGSPTNLRASQLRTTTRRSSLGETGKQILKSNRFIDLLGR